MKPILLIAALALAGVCLAQAPTTIHPGAPVASAVVNANFLGLYNGRVGRWSGLGAPGDFAFSLVGDLYYDTTNPGKVYGCYRVHCTAVAANNWVLVSGGAIASTSSAFRGDGAGNAIAVTGTGTNCVLVNGSSAGCGGLSGLTSTKIPKATGSSTVGDSSLTDNGTTVSTTLPFAAPSAALGSSPPASSVCTIATSGMICLGEGTTPTGTFSGVGVLWPNASTHRWGMVNNATTDVVVGAATTDIFTNKTFDTAGSGNSFKVAGTAITAVSGTGAVCLASGSACSGGAGTVSHLHGFGSGTWATSYPTGYNGHVAATLASFCGDGGSDDAHFIPTKYPGCDIRWYEDGTTNNLNGISISDQVPTGYSSGAVKLTVKWRDNGFTGTYQYKAAYAVICNAGSYNPPATYSTPQTFASQAAAADKEYIQTITLTGISFTAGCDVNIAIGRADSAGYGHLMQAIVEYTIP